MKSAISKSFALCFIFVLAVGATGVSAQDKTPTFKEMLSLKRPSSPIISPDGAYVLFTVGETDWDKNEFKSQIWLAIIATGEARQMTFSEKTSYNIGWSPDSKLISFVSAREEKPQLYALPVSGGEAWAVTKSKTGIGGYEWSPDCKWIAFTTTDDESEKKKKIEEKFGKFEIEDAEFNNSHLWLCEVENGEMEKLVNREDMNVSQFSWSPDSSQIAFSATPDTRPESWSKSDIYIVNISDKSIRELVTQPGPDSSPMWSSCGEYIAFSSKMGAEEYFINSEICVTKVDGGDIICLTESFDENPSLMAWKPNGLYFTALEGMAAHLYRIGRERKISKVTTGEGRIYRAMSLSEDGSRAGFSYLDAATAPEIYWSEVDNFEPVKLTNYAEQIKDWTLGTKEPIKWKSQDGAEVTGVLIKPADFDPAKKYPLFVIIHGGPSSISYPQLLDSYNRIYPIEQWVAKGAIVLEPNYRGSIGFGQDFRKLNYRNLGVGDYWDVISGVDYLVSQGFVDNRRLAAMGWSQGGYISAFITTYSDRFRAVSVGAGISDWVTYYVNTDIHPFTRIYLGANPWEDEEIYRKTSPMTYITNAKTPTLIQHGEFDKRVPIPNAYKLYQGLQDMGVPVKLIVYKGFGHGVNKPKETIAVLIHNWEWFNKYIWGEEPEAEEPEEEAEK